MRDWDKAPIWATAVGRSGSDAWIGDNGYNFRIDESNCHEHPFGHEHPRHSFQIVEWRKGCGAVSIGPVTLSQRYPKYYKPVGELTEVDVYAVHQLFSLDDVSGCIHHASKKLLLSGVRTGGKTKQQDIREARDTLNRWLELNGEGV